MPAAERVIDINAPIDRVWAVITDFGSYPEFLEDVQSVEVIESSENQWEVRLHLHVVRTLTYVLHLERSGPHQLTWSLVEGVFTRNDGSWTLEAVSDTQTRATYRLDIQLAAFVPSAIMRSLVDHSLPATLDSFKARAEAG